MAERDRHRSCDVEADVDDRQRYRIETFDPLLRDLATWGLAVREDTESGAAWVLTEAAQRRLDQIVRPAAPTNVERLVYLDHRCADCRLRGRTRLVDGVFLCDDCFAARGGHDGDAPLNPKVRPPSGGIGSEPQVS